MLENTKSKNCQINWATWFQSSKPQMVFTFDNTVKKYWNIAKLYELIIIIFQKQHYDERPHKYDIIVV